MSVSTSTAWQVTDTRALAPEKPLIRCNRYDENTRKSPAPINVVVRCVSGSSSIGQLDLPRHCVPYSVSPPRDTGGCSIHTHDTARG